MICVLFLKFVGRVKNNKKIPYFGDGFREISLIFNVQSWDDSWTGYGKSLIYQLWYQLAPLSTSPSLLLWLTLVLSNCVQREFERQPFIPPLGLSPVNEEFPDILMWVWHARLG